MSDPVSVVSENLAVRSEPDRVPALAREGQILDRFAEAIRRTGIVGEDKLVKTVYLVFTSRNLDRPVSAAVKGVSAVGKSETVNRVVSFFPASAIYVLTSMSERALAYLNEPLSHRILVVYEAEGFNSDMASYLMRSLLSEGEIRHQIVEKTKDGMRGRMIHIPGPTGLVVTTTRDQLHPENETRVLTIVANDTREQTRRIFLALAAEGDGDDVDREPWHELQTWLDTVEHRVAIPYAVELAELVPPVATRLRRDFGAVLNLIRAHALLHQAQRERDGEGRIVASTEDYGVVRDLVADLVADGVEATVSETIRETVAAVVAVLNTKAEGASVVAVAAELKLDKSSTSRRLRTARRRGFIENREESRGKPARLFVGEPLPEEVVVLPPVDVLRDRCSVAGGTEGDK
jgi:hypothetical protein